MMVENGVVQTQAEFASTQSPATDLHAAAAETEASTKHDGAAPRTEDDSPFGPPPVEDPATYYSTLLEEAAQERHRMEDELARRERKIALLQGDYDRLRQQLPQRVEEAVRRKREESLSGLMELADSLDRALEQLGGASEQVRSGIESLQRQFLRVLERDGIVSLDAMGRSFDPREHEAIGMGQVPTVPENTVIAVARRGFRMGERVVRPASVLVAGPGSGSALSQGASP